MVDQFKVQQVSDAEVNQEFEKLKSQDSSLNDLIQRASDLQKSKATFATDLANVLQKIAAQQATITQDLIAKDSLQQNVASTSAQFDHKLMVAIRDLELRARERLFRYQYYMAKAYEYRMLQQYPSDLNLDATINKIATLMTNAYPPDPTIFATIKAVYLTSVREIVDKSLQDSSSQSIEKQQLLKFELTSDELAALNKLPVGVDQWLPIDVSQRIGPLLGEDNRHIADIVFDQIQVQAAGPIGSFARMRVLVAHDGRSLQSLNGRQYNFYFGLRPQDTSFFWDASYDISSGSLDQAKPSPSAIYQLISLLQLPPTSDPSVLFARPGADRVILYIRREPQPGTLNAQITKLRLAVKVDYFRRNSNLVTLSVQSGDVQPYVAIDRNDVTSRADGLGTFQRTYNVGDRVTLSAEPFHGSLAFKYWSDDSGSVVGTSPTLIVSVSSPLSLHPVYAPALAMTTTSMLYVPITPCRVADTRQAAGAFGGPMIVGQTSRDFIVSDSPCGVPASAQAYSLNVAAVPHGPLGFLTVWPAGQARPLASTLNSDGRVKSNAAIVPAGIGGAISVFATNNSDVVLDINGYFTAAASNTALAYYPLSPCRISDTRNSAGPLGGPFIIGQTARTIPIRSSACSVPATAQAYSVNLAAVPHGSLGFLTAFPTGQARPLATSLNAVTGAVTANAAIIASGTNGSFDIFTSNDTDLVIDINGYFAPPVAGGLAFYNLAPCRVFDSRSSAASQPIGGVADINVIGSNCNPPAGAQSYVFNATAVPNGPLGYLTLWPQGTPQPVVSTLNASDGAVTGNMSIVRTLNGFISAFATNTTHLVLDLFGYFGPAGQ